MALQDVIYKLRNEAHMSREQFALVMGVSQQAVQKWENGNSVPDMKNVVKMAKFLIQEKARYNEEIAELQKLISKTEGSVA